MIGVLIIFKIFFKDERELCENCDFSTSNEVENVDENKDIMSKKKKKLIPRPDLSCKFLKS